MNPILHAIRSLSHRAFIVPSFLLFLIAAAVLTSGEQSAKAHPNLAEHPEFPLWAVRSYQQLNGDNYIAWQTYESSNGAFTCGQLAWHIASGLDFSAGLIEAARAGKQTTIPSFLMPLAYKINELRIKRSSKNATRDSVLADYDREQARLILLLDQCTDADLDIVKTNYAITRSVREMFENPVEHFAEHAPEIRAAL